MRCRCHSSCRRSRFSQLGTQIRGKSSFSSKRRMCCASWRSVFCLRSRFLLISAASPIQNSKFSSASSHSNQSTCPLASIPTRTLLLLAIPAAVAIQNARLFALADIFASELQRQLADLHKAENALAQSEGDRQLSEEKFQKVFRSSPIPFTITTLKEGRFLDVNRAFEYRYGYSREEVLGRTVHDLKIWEDPADRVRMVALLQKSVPIRN